MKHISVLLRALSGFAVVGILCASTPSIAHGQGMSLPPGTSVAVRTIDPIESYGGMAYLEYRATVDDPVMSGERTLIPAGSPAFLRVIEVQQAGALAGQTSLTLVLCAVEVGGQRFALTTSSMSIASSSQAMNVKKSGLFGAIAGAALGAALGGKEGLVKGALAGGAAGAGVAAARRVDVRVKSEARLSFTLSAATAFERGATADEAVKRELIALGDEAGRRVALADREWLEPRLDPAWAIVINGRRVGRTAYLEALKPVEVLSNDQTSEPELRVEGDKLVLSGTAAIKFRNGKKVQTQYQRYADVFTKRNGEWVCLLAEVALTKK